MAHLVRIDEHRTYPPASAHRLRHDIHNPNLVSLVVWTVIAFGGVAFGYRAVRVAMLLWDTITAGWLK